MGSLAIATLPLYLASFDWMVSLMAAFTRTPQGLHAVHDWAIRAVLRPSCCPATFCAGHDAAAHHARARRRRRWRARAIGQVYGVNTLGVDRRRRPRRPRCSFRCLASACCSLPARRSTSRSASRCSLRRRRAFGGRCDRARARAFRSPCSVPRRSSSSTVRVELRSHCSNERSLSIRFACRRPVRAHVLFYKRRPHGDGQRETHSATPAG